MKQVVVRADAAEDIEAARDFYEVQEIGVGDYFVDSVLSDIESLAELSGIHPKHSSFIECWRAVSRLAFIIERGPQTQVFAVLDLRRNPTWIRKELRKRPE